MGARWDGQHTDTFGRIGCFSTQTYKHTNSGKGGLLVTDEDGAAAQVILMSGCYMMYDQHVLRPSTEVFEREPYVTPNFSMCMFNLAAGAFNWPCCRSVPSAGGASTTISRVP